MHLLSRSLTLAGVLGKLGIGLLVRTSRMISNGSDGLRKPWFTMRAIRFFALDPAPVSLYFFFSPKLLVDYIPDLVFRLHQIQTGMDLGELRVILGLEAVHPSLEIVDLGGDGVNRGADAG